jgi:hypothetical protein
VPLETSGIHTMTTIDSHQRVRSRYWLLQVGVDRVGSSGLWNPSSVMPVAKSRQFAAPIWPGWGSPGGESLAEFEN